MIKAVNSIERKRKKAYIRQEYIPGDVVEFDFGVVKPETEDGILTLSHKHKVLHPSIYLRFSFVFHEKEI